MSSERTKRSTRIAEFLGFVCFALALMLLISLATYDPRDPAAFFKSGGAGPTLNFIGPFGAFLAELLFPQLFGVASMLLPMVLGIAGWKLFWCKPIEAPYTKACGITLLLLSLSAFCTLTFGVVQIEGEPVRAGGAIGLLLSQFLTASFNRTGAYILVATSVFVALILATQFSFAAFLRGFRDRVFARWETLRGDWAARREAREKERMRREVEKKHAQARGGGELADSEAAEGPAFFRRVRAASVSAPDELVDLPLSAPATGALSAPASGATPPVFELRKPKQKALPLPMPLPDPLELEPEEGGLDVADVEAATTEVDAVRAKLAAAPAPRKKRTARGDAAGGGSTGALPPASVLDPLKPSIAMSKERLFEKARTLQSKSGEFGVMGSIVEIHPGPVVTTYEFKPDAGVKYSKIVGLADDLALALEAESIRIDRMSGRGTVGIEIPNEVRETIYLREIIESDVYHKAAGRLPLALGKTVSGETYVTDLALMPHLLIAGSTGTGKSVGLNCMISSILFRSSPEEVRLILIDPKRLELGVYEDIPHLLTPVVTDAKIAANVLKWAVGEMEKRIRRLASEGVRNIEQYNAVVRSERGLRSPAPSGDDESGPLHYIVIVIDELADLMMVSSREVEESITRLAQMARAVGIHLILATQRPSVDVITGLIKANFPARISFRVAARVDSRTILDSIGAEQLLGRGDMLFLPPGSARLVRIHGAYVSEKEIARLTEHLRTVGRPVFDETVGKPEKSAEVADDEDRDELFDEAVRFVVSSGQASTSMLQRRFRIGFSRAGRLIDMMERDGIIGPADGSKAREILVPADYYEAVDAWPK